MVGKQRIGDFFVARGLIDRVTAESLGNERLLSETRFASMAVRTGRVTRTQALEALEAFYGYPAVDLDPVVIDKTTLSLIPEQVALDQLILPLEVEEKNLMLAMGNPMDQQVIEEVSFATGLTVRAHICLHDQLAQTIENAYHAEGSSYYGPTAPGGDRTIQIDAAHDFQIIEDGDDDADSDADILLEEGLPDFDPEEPVDLEVKPARILVVEDDPQIQHLIIKTLEADGHRVYSASRGLEALKLIKAKKPELLVLDAMLPEVHGFEICRKVKESKRFGQVPVLMVSAIYRGWRIAEDIKSTYRVDDFMEKPFRIQELRGRVQRLLKHSVPGTTPDELGTQAKDLFNQAISEFQQEHYPESFEFLRRAEELEPFSSRIQFALGQVLQHESRGFQAMYHYEKAIELDPNLYAAAQNLAELYQDKGFKRKAVEMWERALLCAPSDSIRKTIKEHLVSIL